jgi:hypothetical protein
MAIASNDSRVKWYFFLCVPVPVIWNSALSQNCE